MGVRLGRARRRRHRRARRAAQPAGCARWSATRRRTPRSASSCRSSRTCPPSSSGGSGLVAAVVAGIVTGQGAARWFTPEQRLSDELNWRTIELVLEGARLPADGPRAQGDRRGRTSTTTRASAPAPGSRRPRSGSSSSSAPAYVAVLVWLQSRRARRLNRERLESFNSRIDEVAADGAPPERDRRERAGPRGAGVTRAAGAAHRS